MSKKSGQSLKQKRAEKRAKTDSASPTDSVHEMRKR